MFDPRKEVMAKSNTVKNIYDSSIFKTDIAKNMFEQLMNIIEYEDDRLLNLIKKKQDNVSSVDIVSSHFAMALEVYRAAADIECNFRQMNANVTAMVNSIQE
jgi:hypothetical protein